MAGDALAPGEFSQGDSLSVCQARHACDTGAPLLLH